MIRYWAADAFRSWNKRIVSWFVVLSMLLSNVVSIAGTNASADDLILTCGLTEHVHTEGCYEDILICGQEETEPKRSFRSTFSVHRHSDDCYDANGDLVCGREATQYNHIHNEYCKDEDGNLVCGLDLRIPHTHTEECYDADQSLICGKEDTSNLPTFTCTADNWIDEPGHHHDESCYEHRLICGLEEHTHTAECYETVVPSEEPAEETQNDLIVTPEEPAEERQPEQNNDAEEPANDPEPENTQEQGENQQTKEQQPEQITAPESESTQEQDINQPSEEQTEHINTQEPEDSQEQAIFPESVNSEETPETAQPEIPSEENAENKTENGEEQSAETPAIISKESTDAETAQEEFPENVTDSEGPAFDNTSTEDEINTADQGNINDTIKPNDTKETEKTEKTENTSSTSETTVVTEQPSDGTDNTETPAGSDFIYLPETINAEDDTTGPENSDNTDTATAEDNTVGSVSSDTMDTMNTEVPVEPEEGPTIFKTNGNTLICYNGEEETVTIPEGIRKIDRKAFYGNKTLLTVILPDSVEVINSSAFAECSNLEKVVITDQSRLTTISMAAFKNDKKLDISFAANVKSVIANAFEGVLEEETEEEPVEEKIEEPAAEEEKTEKDKTEEEPEKTNNEEPKEINVAELPEEPETKEPTEEPNVEVINDEPIEEPAQESEKLTIPSAEDAPYQVSVTFLSDAGIPEGTRLVVTEPDAAKNNTPKETTPERNIQKSYKKLSMKSAPAEEPLADIPSLTSWNEEEETPDIILYQKILDISLVSEGKEIEPDPDARITVRVTLPEIEAGQDVQVRHITDEGSELLESTNDAGTITFTTGSFSLFEFTSTAQKLNSWTSDLLENTFFGKTSSQGTSYAEINVQNDTEGLTILEAFTVTRSTDLWMTIQRIKDLIIGNLESIALYTVDDGHLGSIVKENITLSDVLRFSLGDLNSFALVRDSGLRRKTEELGNIILNGMLPKNATAEATDVTEAYEDFKPYEETVVAYDITISNNGEEFQPEDDLITVTLQDEQITEVLKQGKPLKLWHIIDENTKEEITDFTVENGAIIFEASGFSAYVLTYSIDKIITLDGETYKVTVSYGEDAEIPEGAELEIYPVDAADYQADAMTALNWKNADYIFYTKFLDISIVKDGEEVKPKAPVSVSIQLLDVTDGAEALQVVHFGADGAEEIDSQAAADGTVTFTTNSFSVFGFGNVLQPMTTAEIETANIEILGFNGEAELTETDAPEVEEGLEVLGTYTLGEDNNASLWIKAELKDDTELSDMESVLVCAVNEEETKTIIDPLTTEGQVAKLENADIAVVKDSGYRHLNLVLNMDEQPNSGEDGQESTEEKEQASNNEDARIITLNGMMPKEAEATAVDVTEAYAEFSAPEAKTDEQETANEKEQEEVGEEEQVEADGDEGGNREEDSKEVPEEDQPTRTTLAAYDISILNNEIKYQPDADRPINVEIVDPRITDKNIELWHINGAKAEQVTDFTVEAGKIVFTACGFSAYVIVHKIETYYVDTESATYKITVEYDDDSGIPDGAELVVTEAEASNYIDEAKVALNWTDTDYVFYTKFLDISIVKDGVEVKPLKPVKVTITLLDVTGGAKALQVVHFGEAGAEELIANSTEEAVITFETRSFSVFGIGNTLHEVQEAENDLANVKILSFDAPAINEAQEETQVEELEQDPEQLEDLQDNKYGLEEGLELVQTISLDNSSSLWLEASLKADAALTNMESVAVYGIEKDAVSETPITEELTDTDQLYALENTSSIAIVKDTGYRRLSIVMNLDHPDQDGAASDGAGESGEETGEPGKEDEESTLPDRIIMLNGMMPKAADAAIADVTEQYTDHEYIVPEEEQPEELSDRTTLAVYSFTLFNHNSEYQPDADHPIHVEIVDPRITAEDGQNIELWHIQDDGTEERVEEFELSEGRIAFTANGFSAYSIVNFEYNSTGWYQATSFEKIDEFASTGFYLDFEKDGKHNYVKSGTETANTRPGIIGITTNEQDPSKAGAVKYYFEKVPNTDDHQYYIYMLEDENNPNSIKYVKMFMVSGNTTRGGFEFVTDTGTAFTLVPDNGKFYITTTFSGQTKPHRWNRNSKNGGIGDFVGWQNDNGNPNNDDARFSLRYYIEPEGDPYDLAGKAFGLMRWNNGTTGRALMADCLGETSMSSQTMMILTNRTNHDDILFVPKDSDITSWRFERIEADKYYLKTTVNGNVEYLKITSGGVTLTQTPDESCIIQVVPGTSNHEGEICLKVGNNTLVYSGNDTTGFGISGTAGDEWLHLVDLADITSDYVVTYTANEVNISDRQQVPDGSRVIIYTRIWDDIHKEYDFYAVDHDGSLIPVYENGDTIQWVGDRLNTLVWDFTEYCYEGTDVPNGYYELMNEYSGRFLGPKFDGQLTSENTVGIILPGRENNSFYSMILAWDDPYYAYAGIKTDGTDDVVTCTRSQAEEFYFAIMEEKISDALTTVSTIDHTVYGVTMKIQDFGTRKEMSDFLGNDAGGAVTTLQKGLLSTNLIDGYPMAAGGSLSKLFNNQTEVNHLFLSGTYYGTGYFEYDSTENFASLHGQDFVVYKEIGTYDTGGNKNTLKHGQFLPFNDIRPGQFASTNGENLYDALGNELPEGHPRKYEKLYLLDGAVDTFFGVELSAAFVQTPSGHDAWGHDIIYEFTGDDDFWLYVDNELIIDLGGIHSAVSGKVNYATGRVEVNGQSTSLRNVFYKNYITRGDTPAQANAKCDEIFILNDDNQWVFREYTAHEMKLFYMERGAGASNLHMRFNLASVKPGQVQLTKKVSGSSDIDYNLAKFPFQIYYRIDGDPENQYTRLAKSTATTESGTEIINVHYANASSVPVDFYPEYEIRISANEKKNYEDVFVLRANETIEISVPDHTIEYYLVECGVNTDVYSNVIVNNRDIHVDKIDTSISNRKDYRINSASVDDRRNVVFENIVNPAGLRTLTIEKKLLDEQSRVLTEENDPTTFKYRIYVSSENNSTPTLAYLLPYRVTNPQGVYCKRRIPDPNDPNDKGGFIPIDGKTDFSTLTDEEKELATFETSTNGTISMIPAGYIVEIPNLPVGTYFKVEERDSDIPDGYKYVQFDYTQSQFYLDGTGNNYVSGGIRPNESPAFTVTNQRGWKLTANKEWTDENVASVMATSRDPIYVAIYINDILLPGSVREIVYPATSTSYYFDTLEAGCSFDQYVIREVTINGDAVTPIDEDGVVSYGWPGKQDSESPRSYIVNYEQGTVEDGTLSGSVLNVREDTITNTRGGGIIYKLIEFDDASNPVKPLKGGVFKLQKFDTVTQTYVDVGAEQYTSGKNGRITILYDFERDTDYVLTQIAAPSGYIGITEPVTIRVTRPDTTDVVTENDDNDPGWISCQQVAQTTGNDLIADVTIRNKPFSLNAIKVRKSDQTPLAGAVFALYRQIKSLGGLIKDKNPMTNYSTLISNAEGIIPKIDQTLKPSTYYLTEVTPPDYYIGLTDDILLTISNLGEISISCPPENGVVMNRDTTDPYKDVYTIIIPNEKTDMAPPFLSVEKQVQGRQADYGKDFTFTLSGLNPNQEYAYIRYVTQDGEQWTPANGTGTVEKINANSSGEIEFKLKHHERITFSLAGEESIDQVQVVESNSDNKYTTTHTVDAGEIQQGRDTGNITLNTDTRTVQYTNTLVSVSPTGIAIRYTPYFLILMLGLLLMFFTGVGIRTRRKEINAIMQKENSDRLSDLQEIRENETKGGQHRMKKLLSLLTILVIGAVGTAQATEVEDDGTGETGKGLTQIEIPKEIVLFNTTESFIYEPNITYTYSISNQNPGSAVITDADSNTGAVKTGVTGLVKIQGSDKTGYIGVAGTDPVNLVFDDTFTLKETNRERSQVTTQSKVTTRYLKLTFDVSVLKDNSGNYLTDAAGIYRYKITDKTSSANLSSAGIKRNSKYDKDRYLDVYVEWADDEHTTPRVYGIVLYKTSDGTTSANGGSSFVHNSNKTTYLKVTGYNVESEMRSRDGSSNPTTDEYHTYNLKVSKEVAGDSADPDHPFPISVQFSNTYVKNMVTFYSTGAFLSSQLIMGEGACNINGDFDEAGPQLKDQESFTMIGLPEYTTFIVNEKNDTESSYIVTIRDDTAGTYLKGTANDGGETVTGGFDTALSSSNTMSNLKSGAYEAEDIHIINELGDIVAPTGITSRTVPFIIMMIFGIVLILIPRRMKNRRQTERMPKAEMAKDTVQSQVRWIGKTPMGKDLSPLELSRKRTTHMVKGPPGKRGGGG